MYGPFDGKSMRLFIDDLNLCGSDEFGNQPANEVNTSSVIVAYSCYCLCCSFCVKSWTNKDSIAQRQLAR